jgi:hypothetical protein
VIAFGCAVTDPGVYERFAQPGIERAREPDSAVLVQGTTGGTVSSVFRNYNLLLDSAAQLDDLEALVIVHQDAEIVDSDACAKIRAALADDEVGLVGCAGAVGVRSIAWWEGSVTWSAFTHQYEEYGGGDIPSLSWDPEDTPSYAQTGEVDSIDGFVLVFSPRALRELRFDESLGRFHGYDYDVCMQARAAGMKVVTADIRTIHHHSLELISDVEAWVDAHMRLAEKWGDRFGDDGAGSDDWVQRARRAEAEAAAERLLHGRERLVSRAMRAHDKVRIAELEGDLERVAGSFSWRITAPIRALAAAARRRRNGSG